MPKPGRFAEKKQAEKGIVFEVCKTGAEHPHLREHVTRPRHPRLAPPFPYSLPGEDRLVWGFFVEVECPFDHIGDLGCLNTIDDEGLDRSLAKCPEVYRILLNWQPIQRGYHFAFEVELDAGYFEREKREELRRETVKALHKVLTPHWENAKGWAEYDRFLESRERHMASLSSRKTRKLEKS